MTAIRAVFDGKAFVPQQPVALPNQAEALVLVDSADRTAQERLDREIRQYYQGAADAEDGAWRQATETDSIRAWDEE
jgi:hypothetical protein